MQQASAATEKAEKEAKSTEAAKKTEEKPKKEPFESYLVWLDEGVIINAKPDASSDVTYVIDTATKYTIVEEAYDKSGDRWGKLKSGVGWVNLSKMPKEEKKSSDSFESYLVWLDEGVIINKKPDASSDVTYVIDTATKYTIVEEAYDKNGDRWGKLKSGVGWVNLSKMPKEEKKSSDSFESYLVWLDVGVKVYAEPDSNSKETYVIDTATKYTIVEEAYDKNGDRWGKLKSGVGWVNLSDLD